LKPVRVGDYLPDKGRLFQTETEKVLSLNLVIYDHNVLSGTLNFSCSWKNIVPVAGRTEMVTSWFTAGRDNRVSVVLRASVDMDHVHL